MPKPYANPVLKEAAIAAYNGNGAALARALEVTAAAVYQWPSNKPIPERHALRLRYQLKRNRFDQHGRLVSRTRRVAR
jgi:hypothetical protein